MQVVCIEVVSKYRYDQVSLILSLCDCHVTDTPLLLQLNIPALGFSPMRNTPILLHSHNERLNEKIYLEGIEIYAKVIHDIANVRT